MELTLNDSGYKDRLNETISRLRDPTLFDAPLEFKLQLATELEAMQNKVRYYSNMALGTAEQLQDVLAAIEMWQSGLGDIQSVSDAWTTYLEKKD